MLRERLSPPALRCLMILALLATLVSTAWAKPKFNILKGISGGLFSGLTFDAQGRLYGVTGGGGTDNQGTIFQLTRGSNGKWKYALLHNFDGNHGGSPNGGLIFDAAGNFYGTALGGKSSQGGGLAYQMIPETTGWRFTVLYYFCIQYHCPDGGFPGPLVMDGAGNLYGLAAGGKYGEGVAYELTPGSGGWNESVLYDFDGNKGGIGPSGALILDAAGRLYGTTATTNIYQSGTVFRLKEGTGGWKLRTLWQFDGNDGLRPYSGVVFDSSGRLYGTTSQGGGSQCGETTCGTVFKLTSTRNGRWKETMLYDFPNPIDGNFPGGGLVFDKAGNLYGVTVAGGIGRCSGGCGVVYKMAPVANGKWKYTVLHRFTGTHGGQPMGALILDQKGHLYGTAYDVVYEITP